MSHRDFAFVAVGRFLAVERYRETQLSSPPTGRGVPDLNRTGGHADGSNSRSGSQAPARLQHR
jgi:hypothetical protein